MGPGGLLVNVFDYQPTLAAHIASAALVISHAGSGSLFEALNAGRPTVAVVNEGLMDNHQEARTPVASLSPHVIPFFTPS